MIAILNRVLLAAAILQTTHAAGTWSYHGSDGPTYWYQQAADCNGPRQSPITIYEGDVVQNAAVEVPFIYSNYGQSIVGMKLFNNGHTVGVTLPASPALTITGAGLPNGDTFQAIQFHFHWGSGDGTGSEHLVNKHAFPMELHIVHINTKYDNATQALGHADGAAVLGFMFEISNADNAAYSDIISNLVNVQNLDDEQTLNTAVITSFLPTLR